MWHRQRGAFFLISIMQSESGETQSEARVVMCMACRSVAIVAHHEPLRNRVRLNGQELLRTGTRLRILCPECGDRTQVEFDDEQMASKKAEVNATDN